MPILEAGFESGIPRPLFVEFPLIDFDYIATSEAHVVAFLSFVPFPFLGGLFFVFFSLVLSCPAVAPKNHPWMFSGAYASIRFRLLHSTAEADPRKIEATVKKDASRSSPDPLSCCLRWDPEIFSAALMWKTWLTLMPLGPIR